MLKRINTFIIRFLATFFQFFLVALISKQNNNELLAFYFLYLAFHQVGSYALNFGFERIALISISKNPDKIIDFLHQIFKEYSKILINHFYVFILLLIVNIYLFDINLIDNFMIIICCLLFSFNLINGQSIIASNSPNVGIFFVRVFYLIIISFIFAFYNYSNYEISKNIIIYSFLLATSLSLLLSYLFIKINFSKKIKNNSNTKIQLSFDQYKIQILNIIFQRLPIFLLNILFFDKMLVAAFSLIHSIASIRGTIVDVLASQFVPKFLKMYDDKSSSSKINNFFRKIQIYTFLLNCIYGIIILFFGNEILNYFNPEFLTYFDILFLWISVNVILSLFGLSIFINSTVSIKNTLHLKFILISIFLMILLAYTLNVQLGIYGLFLAILSSQILLSILSYLNVNKLLKNHSK
jgi:hypothetical protein